MASSPVTNSQKPVFVVTGPSGAGKGTLIQLVLPRFPELTPAVSATTRSRRPAERDGVEYHFLDHDTFQAKVDAGEFLEYVDYVGNRYGTLRSEIDRLRAAGKAPLLELETEGALRVKRREGSAELGGAGRRGASGQELQDHGVLLGLAERGERLLRPWARRKGGGRRR